MSKNDASVSKQMKELQEILDWFDQEDIDLDKAVEKFERGTELANSIKKQLSEIENKVTKIQAKLDE